MSESGDPRATVSPAAPVLSSATALLDALRLAVADRYDVKREIGRGGNAIVFLAQHRSRDVPVAIKVLRPELVEAVNATRFVREVELARRLTHPAILPLLDAGSMGDLPYYVMPYVDGESLQTRLKRERVLTLDEAMRIVRGVGDALDYAHALGLIHRDIKPANILLGANDVVVADFGIARAVSEAAVLGTGAISIGTPTGVAIGTPEYMSPEQAGGERALDGRSDIYALGCVVYEMLGGEPPFTGRTPAAIVARHQFEPPRSLRVIRPTVSAGIQRAIEIALAKDPVDRFSSAAAFVAALEAARAEPTGRWYPIRSWVGQHRRALAAAALFIAAVAWASPRGMDEWRRRAAASMLADLAARADTMRYAVLPPSDPVRAPDVAALLRASMRKWDGIVVVDAPTLLAAQARADGAHLHGAPNATALLTGAGRYVRTHIVRVGDSLRVRAAVFDARRDSLLGEDSVLLPLDSARATHGIELLGDRVLFAGLITANDEGPAGTSSYAARRAYLNGMSALDQWDLPAADSGFRAATQLDAAYAQAHLHLALVRVWNDLPVSQWAFAAERAAQSIGQLPSRDRFAAAALLELAHGRRDVACERWREGTRREPREFSAWYGLGNCLDKDSVVVRDPRSPSGWRFRSSSMSALRAFDRSIQLHDVISGGWVAKVRELLHTTASWARLGVAAAPDTTQFVAVSMWRGDSLNLVPVPATRFDRGGAVTSGGEDEAVLQARQRLLSYARMWRTRAPESAVGLEALAVALDLLANPSAFDTLRLAREHAAGDADRLRLGILEVWMRTKYSAPDHLDGLLEARRLADSLLKDHQPVSAVEARQMASLAALTGRAHLAARYTRTAMGPRVDPSIEASGPRLVAYAALGGPPDTLRTLALATERGIASGIVAADRERARAEFLTRSAMLALPDSSVASLLASGDMPPLNLLTAWRAHDLGRVKTIIAGWRADPRRRGLHAFDVTIDVLAGEALALESLGDMSGAIATLDPALDSLSLVATQRLTDAVRAGSFVRTMVMRARLANASGDDRTARRWARAALALWSDADEILKPAVEEMRRIAHEP